MDTQACPMATPPLPHGSGPISGPGVATVLIGGKPAATVGDTTVCTGPPGTIAFGCPTVFLGTLTASPSAGAGAVKAATQAAHSALVGDQVEGEGPHWTDIQFLDQAGNPVAQAPYELTGVDGQKETHVLPKNGKIRRGNLPKAGQYMVRLLTLSNAKWSSNHAKVGESVRLSADAQGHADETDASFAIWRRNAVGGDDFIAQLSSKVKAGKAEAEWKYDFPAENDDRPGQDDAYCPPDFYFMASVGDCKARSDILEYKDSIDVSFTEHDGKPAENREYALYLPDGTIRQGKLDSKGHLKEEGVPPGKSRVKLNLLRDDSAKR
jgi:uncharacterized Zn-binding protein involved in type VI secretion